MSAPQPSTAEAISWFSSFPPFEYNTAQTLQQNFARLSASRHWGKELNRKRWIQCQTAVFGALFGRDADVGRLERWQDLCREVGVENVPGSIGKCKAALRASNVLINLVNLIDHRMMGDAVPLVRFTSYKAWREYTKGNMYPRKAAKEEGFIRALLRKL
ncbi:hypothetical protein ACN47E_005756 [Coniothyrium glycines]